LQRLFYSGKRAQYRVVLGTHDEIDVDGRRSPAHQDRGRSAEEVDLGPVLRSIADRLNQPADAFPIG
jgi:hypothetical protein